jgi:hypothetical protein
VKWISAVELPKKGVTRWFEVRTKEDPAPGTEWAEPVGKLLGIVKWHPGWRRFAFFPLPQTLFEADCLRDLADFCANQTEQRKAEREAGGHFFQKLPDGASKCAHCESPWIDWHDTKKGCPANPQ